MEYILRGNFIIILIGMCSIVSLAIFLERFFYIRKLERDSRSFFKESLGASSKEDILSLCLNFKGVLGADIVSYILSLSHKGDAKACIDESLENSSPKLEVRISAIGTIASISPLLGLLGTVLGMIDSLKVLESDIQSSNMQYTSGLLNGIWTALITTAAGLIVAIPSLTVYNYLVNKVDSFIKMSRSNISNIVDKVLRVQSF